MLKRRMPIHIPGAVQGFGVLIALEEDLNGNLVVRVVSENCTEILGLSPSYLFNLECFTHTLTQMQADNLWDNIQYLSDPANPETTADGNADEAPQVFLLSGYGQPGSAVIPGSGETSSGGEDASSSSGRSAAGGRPGSIASSTSSAERRQWSCWCAAHRPKMIPPPPVGPPSMSPSSSSNSGTANPNPGGEPTPAGSPPDEQHFPQALIILELELEHDMYNPLYPPPPELLAPSGNASPGSGTRSSMSVNSGGSGSGATPVQGSIPPGGRTSDGSDRTIMPSSVTPPASRSGASVGADSPSGVTGGDAAMTSSNDMRSTLQSVDENSTNMTTITPTTAMPASSSANTSASIDSGLARPTPSTTSSGESITPRPPASITPTASNPTGADPKDLHIGGPGDQGEDESTWGPTAEQILASTTSRAQPIRALERMRQAERTAQQRRLASLRRGGSGGSGGSGRRGGAGGRGGRHQHRSGRLAYGGSGSLDVFSVLGQVNEQLSAANDLQTFLDVVVGLMKDLTQFHRVLIYQFDEIANGQVVAELVDYTKTKDLYRGLHFPAADIPPQARELYKINKVRSLYDRDQTTARLVGRTKADVELPLDLTHSYLRAMSPIHLKYLGNMGVRSSMSISIVSFGQLWGLICCHSYGDFGMRVSFPVRQMLRLLSDSISRNIERLSYAHRLHTRKLINTIPTEAHPTGHIVSNAEDLLGLFDADFGVLVIGEGAKILGPNEKGQEIYLIAEYLRVKQFKIMQATQDIRKDFPDVDKLENQTQTSALNAIAGVLYVPLSAGGKDFIALLRKGQLREVTWAGRANKGADGQAALEPRASFKAWSEIISSRSRAWTDEQLETAGVLALVYGKFIDVWRQKETAVKATQLTNLLLSNASHEVRTPLNHIINYLELAMNGPLDKETRENLSMSHAASKNLLFTINDLLDLTRLEQGNETSLNEPFDLSFAIEDSIEVYRTEAERRNIRFSVITDNLPRMVIGDSKKIRTIVANLTANAVKFTEEGEIHVEARLYPEPPGLRDPSQIVIEVIVRDTGRGIEGPKLEGIFRDLEQIEHAEKSDKEPQTTGLGLGLAVVAHIIGQLSGQLRVDSKPGVGSQFVFLVPFNLPTTRSIQSSTSSRALSLSSNSGVASAGSRGSRHDVSRGHDEIDSLVEALNSSPSANMSPAERWNSQTSLVSDPRVDPTTAKATARSTKPLDQRPVSEGEVELSDSNFPLRSVRVDAVDVEVAAGKPPITSAGSPKLANPKPTLQLRPSPQRPPSFVVEKPSFHVLIVEDDVVNRNVLAKRLKMDGHQVSTSVNGQEAVDLIKQDRAFDCVLMDIQMPILDGFGAAEQIREIEKANPLPLDSVRPSTDLNSGIPIVAVSASLKESQRQFMLDKGMDAWILKPINFKRLGVLLRGCIDTEQRKKDLYRPGGDWERGGWMREPVGTIPMGDITSPTSEAGPSK
ncbi:hypothetical protein DL93DRAFT_120462 [Clavulina sp. PMI_390]|nr:hypothetical protein DL93DRAFT_120462 [Clavulina sp. PMI_390]